MKNIFFSFIILFSIISCNKQHNTEKDLQFHMVKDSLKIYEKLYEEAAYFSIDKNENAQKKFEPEIISDVMQTVVNDLADFKNKDDQNVLIPTGTKINKLSVINHKWLILDYYGDNNVGELLIEYNYQPNEKTTFKIIDSAIY